MAGFPTGRIVRDAAFVEPRAARTLGIHEFDNRLFFHEPRGTLGFVLTPPWSKADLEAGTNTTPGGFKALLWILQYLNPPTGHYWSGGYDASLGAGNGRWFFEVKSSGSPVIATHPDEPERFEPRGCVWRWTSEGEGELGLPANSIDVFIGTPGQPMTQGVSAVVSTRPNRLLDGGRVQFNTLSARVSNIFSEAEVWPLERIVAWWNQFQ